MVLVEKKKEERKQGQRARVWKPSYIITSGGITWVWEIVMDWTTHACYILVSRERVNPLYPRFPEVLKALFTSSLPQSSGQWALYRHDDCWQTTELITCFCSPVQTHDRRSGGPKFDSSLKHKNILNFVYHLLPGSKSVCLTVPRDISLIQDVDGNVRWRRHTARNSLDSVLTWPYLGTVVRAVVK